MRGAPGVRRTTSRVGTELIADHAFKDFWTLVALQTFLESQSAS